MSVIEIVFKLGGITSYSVDVGTDINSGIQYILRGDVWWGVLTLSFVVLSMLSAGILMFRLAIKGKVKKWNPGSAVLFLVFFPIVPLSTLFWDLVLKVNEWWHSDSDSNKLTKNSTIVVVAVVATAETTQPPKVTTATATSSTLKVTVEMPTGTSSSNNDNTIQYDTISNNTSNNVSGRSINSRSSRNNGNISVTIRDITSDRNNTSNSNTTSDTIPIHIQAAASTKLSEALTESVPQACIGMHVVFRTLFVPEVGGEVEWFQWLSLAVSICALSYSIVTNEFFKGDPILAKVSGFFCLIPAIISRLAVCATMGTVHPAMFLAPLGTEVLAHCLLILIVGRGKGCGVEQMKEICCGAKLWTHMFAIVFISNISTCFAIGGYFTSVPQYVTIPTLFLNFFYGIAQAGIWVRILHLKMKTVRKSDNILSTGRKAILGSSGVIRPSNII